MKTYPSQLLTKAIAEFAKLPGIGERTSLRLMLHLLRQEEKVAVQLGEALIRMRTEINYCSKCHNISDEPLCEICKITDRNTKIVCVVENVQDVLAIEKTQLFNGLYHVLGGVISPLDGIKPSDLNLDNLFKRVEEEKIEELILALNPTMEGDATNFYIARQLAQKNIKLTTLARGVTVGNEIEYTDEVTLGRSLLNRVPLNS